MAKFINFQKEASRNMKLGLMTMPNTQDEEGSLHQGVLTTERQIPLKKLEIDQKLVKQPVLNRGLTPTVMNLQRMASKIQKEKYHKVLTGQAKNDILMNKKESNPQKITSYKSEKEEYNDFEVQNILRKNYKYDQNFGKNMNKDAGDLKEKKFIFQHQELSYEGKLNKLIESKKFVPQTSKVDSKVKTSTEVRKFQQRTKSQEFEYKLNESPTKLKYLEVLHDGIKEQFDEEMRKKKNMMADNYNIIDVLQIRLDKNKLDHLSEEKLLAQHLIERYLQKDSKDYKSPFYALSMFVDQNLGESVIIDDKKQGSHFKSAIALFTLKQMAIQLPDLWKPIVNRLSQVFYDVIFYNSETYQNLYDKQKTEYDIYRHATKKMEQRNFSYIKKKELCQKLMQRLINHKLLQKAKKIIRFIREEVKLKKEKIRQDQVSATLLANFDKNRIQNDKVKQKLFLYRAFICIKNYKQDKQIEYFKNFTDLLNEKIQDLENDKIILKDKIKDQNKAIQDLKDELMKTITDYRLELKQYKIYKFEATEKKPQELKNVLQLFLKMVYDTNILIKRIQIGHSKTIGQGLNPSDGYQVNQDQLRIQDNQISLRKNCPKFIFLQKDEKAQIFMQHLIFQEHEQIYANGGQGPGISQILEKASIQEVLLRWIKFIKTNSSQSLKKLIELSYEQKRKLEFQIAKFNLEKQKATANVFMTEVEEEITLEKLEYIKAQLERLKLLYQKTSDPPESTDIKINRLLTIDTVLLVLVHFGYIMNPSENQDLRHIVDTYLVEKEQEELNQVNVSSVKTQQIMVLKTLLMNIFKIHLNQIASDYEIYFYCFQENKSLQSCLDKKQKILTQIFQVIFLRDKHSLTIAHEKIEEMKDTLVQIEQINEQQMKDFYNEMKLDSPVLRLQTDLENSNKFNKKYRDVLKQKCSPIVDHMANNQMQDIFCLLTQEEHKKMLNTENFQETIQFIKDMGDEEILLRWLNFLYRAYQQQEFDFLLELKIKLQYQIQQREMAAQRRKTMFIQRRSPQGSQKIEDRNELITTPAVQNEQVQINLDTFQDVSIKFKQIQKFEELFQNNFQILLKIIAYLSPESIFDELDLDKMSQVQIQKIVGTYQNKYYLNEYILINKRNVKTILQEPKLAIFCDYYIDNVDQEAKTLYLISQIHHLTQEIDYLNIDQLTKMSRVIINGKNFNNTQLSRLKKLLARIFLQRPLMNTNQGLSSPGIATTLFNQQLEKIQQFYLNQKEFVEKFDHLIYDKLQEYIDEFKNRQEQAIAGLRYVSVCDEIYRDNIKIKMVQLANHQEEVDPTMMQFVFKVQQSQQLSVYQLIDKQIKNLDFQVIAENIKVSKFQQVWKKSIQESLLNQYNLLLKQFLINQVNLFRTYPQNQKDLFGEFSYIKLHKVFKNFNFEMFKLRPDEIENVLFQYVNYQYQSKQKNDNGINQFNLVDIQTKKEPTFSNRMKSRIDSNATNSDISELGVTQTHTKKQDTSRMRITMFPIEIQDVGAALYNWNFTIQDFIQILLIFLFTPGQRRQQIIFELLSQKNPDLLMKQFGKYFGMQQLQNQQIASQVSFRGEINADAIHQNNLRKAVDYLDLNCIVNGKIAQTLFEQFLIHFVFIQKNLVQSKGVNQNQSSYEQYINQYLSLKLDQIYIDIMPPKHLQLLKNSETDSRYAPLNKKQKIIVDSSFEPFKKCLIALWNYYLIEHSQTHNHTLIYVLPKSYKNFCMHVYLMVRFIQDFQDFQKEDQKVSINYVQIFKFLYRQLKGINIDLNQDGIKFITSHSNLNSGKQTKPSSKQKSRSKSHNDYEKKANEAKFKEKSSYLIFSEFVEILFNMSIYCNNDPSQSDILKFKMFLQTVIFNNIKHNFRQKPGDEEKKPYKIEALNLLNKVHVVQTSNQ